MLRRIHRSGGWRIWQWAISFLMIMSLAIPAQIAPPGSSGSGGKLISLNFRDAPLDQVLNFYGELTGRTMIKSQGINATITLRGQTRLTEAEAMIAIESILSMNNITLVPMGEKFFKVVQTAQARQEGMKIEAEISEEPFPETDTLISQMIQLKYLEIAEVQPVIQGLLHGYGKIQALERINTLLITDTASNLQRILEVLEFIDRPIETRVETRIYELRYAEAGKIAGRLNELIADSQSKEAKPRVAVVPRAPAGVIRARQARQTAARKTTETELAERGIIQGKVKLVADDRTNILIVISEPPNFIFFDKIVAVLDRPVEPEIIVRVVALEYADAEEISGILNDFIGAASAEKTQPGAATASEDGGATSPRARALEEFVARRAQERKVVTGDEKTKIGQLSEATKILADKRTNSLLLMGRKADIAALEDVIDQLDVMLAQVIIEAVIIEVSLSDSLSYGVDWLQRSMTIYNEELAGPRGGITVREPVAAFGGGWATADRDAGAFKDGSNIQRDNISLSGGALTYYLTMFDLNVDAIIRLAAGSSDARVLATPVIMTTDNTEAKFVAGEERPIVTSTTTSADTAAQTSQYEYKNIGLDLTVTPHINPRGFVVMEITQTADNVLDSVQIDGNEVPVISKRELTAEVAVDNRSTIVLGGLVNTREAKGRTKIPILGDIPLLGTFFRSDTRDSSRTELLVLITPYVMMTPEDVDAETKRIHSASNVSKTPWPAGWSDSKLATKGPEEIKQEKREKRAQEREDHAKRRATAKERKRQLKLEREETLRKQREEETLELKINLQPTEIVPVDDQAEEQQPAKLESKDVLYEPVMMSAPEGAYPAIEVEVVEDAVALELSPEVEELPEGPTDTEVEQILLELQ